MKKRQKKLIKPPNFEITVSIDNKDIVNAFLHILKQKLPSDLREVELTVDEYYRVYYTKCELIVGGESPKKLTLTHKQKECVMLINKIKDYKQYLIK